MLKREREIFFFFFFFFFFTCLRSRHVLFAKFFEYRKYGKSYIHTHHCIFFFFFLNFADLHDLAKVPPPPRPETMILRAWQRGGKGGGGGVRICILRVIDEMKWNRMMRGIHTLEGVGV